MVAACPAFLHFSLLVGFDLVTDNLPVVLVRIRYLRVVARRTRLFLLVGRGSEYQPHGTDEDQNHCRQDYHLLTFQPLRLRQWCTFPVLLFGAVPVLFSCFLIFHPYTVL